MREWLAARCVCVHGERVCRRGGLDVRLVRQSLGPLLGPAAIGSEERHNINARYTSARFPQTSLSSPVLMGKVPRRGHGVIMWRDAFTGLLTGSTDGLLRMVEMVTHTHTQTGFNGF